MHDILIFIEEAFHKVNYIEALVIGLICAVLMRRFGHVIVFAILAVIAHLAFSRYLMAEPLPDFSEMRGQTYTGFLWVGYLVLISIFFVLKSAVFSKRSI